MVVLLVIAIVISLFNLILLIAISKYLVELRRERKEFDGVINDFVSELRKRMPTRYYTDSDMQ
jgi:hypothetical protein